MNTGIQRSGATPYGASTTTSPNGSGSFGEDKPKKEEPKQEAPKDEVTVTVKK